ncbi:MAG: AAA family ATPase [Desulfotomaculaceae bacterium]|nr:AAA family ATPase [Desulfotomaculaceae bacterium]
MVKASVLKKIIYIEDALNSIFLEREELISLMMLTVFSKQNMFILGKTGIAKSQIVNVFSSLINNIKIFKYLLTKYTTPEEIFGPVSLVGLKNDRFVRKIDNRLANVEIGFLDEIFKGNSSILNSLLMIANEKVYVNDLEVIKVPLISLFGASNEVPDDEEMDDLQALYDRFTIKYISEPIKYFKNFTSMLLAEDDPAKIKAGINSDLLLDLDDLEYVFSASQEIKLELAVINVLYKMREFCQENNYYISDRKFKNIVRILKVCAFINNRASIKVEDLFIVPFMAWEQPEDYNIIRKGLDSIIIASIFNNILSNISMNISDDFDHVIKDLISNTRALHGDYIKCYSYLKESQKKNLYIQHGLIKEYIYKLNKIINQLELELANYSNQKEYLKITNLFKLKVESTILDRLDNFKIYYDELKMLDDKVSKALLEEDHNDIY